LLSGEGSDETLGGYLRYRPLRHPALLNTARPFMPALGAFFEKGGRWRKLARFLALGPLDRFVLFNACEVLPPDLEQVGLGSSFDVPFREQVLQEARAYSPDHLMRQAMYSDQHTFLCSLLDRNDRMTMGASIECRVPFLDYRLVEGLAAMPSSVLLRGQSKQLLRDALGSRLPAPVLAGRKWGFGVPWGEYFRRIPELRERLEGLPDSPVIRESPLDRQLVRETLAQFLKGDRSREAVVTQLMMIGLWHDVYFRRLADLRKAGEPALPAAGFG
jgi:asparagine synthase (glutamine-hydrolysing)